jgi:rubrerythrin
MPAKPSYLGLLNAIANGETQAGHYFGAWLKVTRDPAVRELVQLVAIREAEHGLAFEKRIVELGYSLIEKPNPEAKKKQAVLADPKKSDLDKLLFLGYGEKRADPFGKLFDDHTIDPQTGALMGRYVAEERDTIRRLYAITDKLKKAKKKAA